MKINYYSLFVGCLMIAIGGTSCRKTENYFSGNPIVPGVYADPCILQHQDTFYLYGTTGNYASVWYSADFKNWQMRKLNWPTSMQKPNIWAPAVSQGPDGRFYFYSSVDHNIYAGVADHPAGPFENILGGDSIFIKNRQWWNKMHSIDADCFVDDDGQAYLYWGSGFDFVDGICAVGRLGTDMASFRETPQLITPDGYFEGPHMMKRGELYYLMYSDGHFYDSTYKVRYAIGDHPLGPFTEGKNSPILASSADGSISGPGHHYTMQLGGSYYIVYHAHAQPLYKPHWGPIRQVFIDKLEFEEDGMIKKVQPTDEGVKLDFIKKDDIRLPVEPVSAEASGKTGESYGASNAFDSDFGTLWSDDKEDVPAWIIADFGQEREFRSCEIFYDLIDGDYEYILEYSIDGEEWNFHTHANNADAEVWPIEHTLDLAARYFRITILDQSMEPNRVGIWEARFF